jgi:DedD protein
MDTAMRDLDQMREHGEEESPGRKAAMLGMAGLATVTLVFAMGVLLGGSPEAETRRERDPLSALDEAAAITEPTAAEEETAVAAPTVDPAGMTFHEALVGDDRPEVEAALAQAAAEEAHLDPIAPEVPGAESTTTAPVIDMAPTPPAWAPAGDVALAPARTAIPSEGPRARAGHDGDLTLQVASYRTEQEAEIFAEALRARGHAAFVIQAEIPDRGTYFRVRIGPFETVGEAESYRSTFEQEERMNTYVARRRDGEQG